MTLCALRARAHSKNKWIAAGIGIGRYVQHKASRVSDGYVTAYPDHAVDNGDRAAGAGAATDADRLRRCPRPRISGADGTGSARLVRGATVSGGGNGRYSCPSQRAERHEVGVHERSLPCASRGRTVRLPGVSGGNDLGTTRPPVRDQTDPCARHGHIVDAGYPFPQGFVDQATLGSRQNCSGLLGYRRMRPVA